MKPSSVISIGLISFVLTVALLSQCPSLSSYAWLWLLASSLIIILCVFCGARKNVVCIAVILFASVLGAFRVASLTTILLKEITPGPSHFTAQVLGTERREDGYLIRLWNTPKRSDMQNKNTCIGILAKTPNALRLRRGDRIVATGVIAPLEEDSYGHYLRSQGVECTMESFKVLSVSPGSLWNPLRMLEGIREKTERTITQVFPEPDASLVMGLLTGSRGMIPSTLQTDFKTSGLTHILAISGYNITMILLLLSSAFCWLPLKARIIPCALILIGFTFFTGASASVVRACIMGLLGLLALGTGREQMMRLSILWTLVLMTLWNPLQLWWDSGFHLSFLALGGLVEFSEKIAPWSQKVLPSTMGIEESIRGTLAAQVLTSPWILLAFERLSIIAPLSNLVVLPAVPFAMATGSIATLLGIIWLPLGSLAALAALPFTRWITGMTELLARIPGASIEGQPGTLWIAVSYGLIALWWYRGLPAVEK